VLSILTKKKRAALVKEAIDARRDAPAMVVAWVFVILYNFVGVLDIFSTAHAIGIGAAEEANPVMSAAMDHFGTGWAGAKLILQMVVSLMVLWFPHRFVLAMFIAAVAFNIGVVYSNLQIGGLL
jgi:hypothetical protein